MTRSLIFLLILLGPQISLGEEHPIRPNILLIYVDDLGYGDLSSFGHEVINTPNLDRLANSGLIMTNYYAPSALCSPSRAGLLTGRTPYRTGIESWIPEGSGKYLSSDEITLAEVLKEVDYSTAAIGKWHLNSGLGNEDEPQPNDQGFDYYYGHNAFQIPSNRNPTNIFRNGKLLEEQAGFTAELYVDEAIRWLRDRNNEQPFFLFLSMAEPHGPIENPPEYNKIYSNYTHGDIQLIPTTGDSVRKDKLIPRGPGEYYANITYMDAQLGRILKELDLTGIREQTIVVFASDNGPVTPQWLHWYEVNSYGSTAGLRGRKHLLYEGGIKVPAIISYPGVIQPGSECNDPVIGMDIFVTLANIAAAKIPSDRPIDGIDIQPAFTGDRLDRESMFWALASVSELEFAVREGYWKLLLNSEGQPRELFNLQEDPLELFNEIANRPEKSNELFQIFIRYKSSIDNDSIAARRP